MLLQPEGTFRLFVVTQFAVPLLVRFLLVWRSLVYGRHAIDY